VKSKVSSPSKTKRGWRDYVSAFGRAHRKASVQMESSVPLLKHLDELRMRIFKAFFALIVTTSISFVFSQQLIEYLAQPIGGIAKLVSIELTENIAIFMKVSLLGGFVLGMPVILYQIVAFIMPGLKRNEQKWLLIMIPFAAILFAGGVAFTWFVMLPTAVPFLAGFLGITTQVRPENYFKFITNLMFWIGICFEMPLIIMFLAKLKFVTARQLVNGWRYAVVLMAIIAAIVTPTVDPINMGLVMAPLAGLYVISIILAAIVGRR
jgi:sec-independent protein translocase protein TatC